MPKSLGSLAVGAKIKDPSSKFLGQPVIWKIADINHAGYPSGAVTLITERCIAFRSYDAKEPGNSNSDRANYGNNRYLHSNLRLWLNSAAASWYAAQHSADAPPTAANVYSGWNAYDTKPGFLNAFSAQFRAALMATTLTVVKNTVTDGGGSETLTDKIFLASTTEVGLANESGIVEGSKLALFSTDASRVAYCTTEAIADGNATSGNEPANNTAGWYWWLRTPYASDSRYARYVYSSGVLDDYNAFYGYYAVRPLCNLNSSILVSDAMDGDGCYTIVWNTAPTAPPTITPPGKIFSNRAARITWGASTDPDGDTITYKLERSYNNGAYTQVYSGTGRTFDDTPTTAMNTIRWRVKAVDTYNNESGYTTTATLNVIHNQPPVISGSNGSLGMKAGAFSYAYTITDPDNDAVSVVEAVDGRALKNYSVTLGKENRMEVAGNEWVRLAQGNHTLTVTATDTSGNVSVRTMTFTKQAAFCSVTLTDAERIEVAQMPERITISVTREVAAGALFLVEVCNNAFDAVPTWEDATAEVVAGLAHVFTNKVKTSTKWGVNIRAKIERNGAVGDCWISGIGGNIE